MSYRSLRAIAVLFLPMTTRKVQTAFFVGALMTLCGIRAAAQFPEGNFSLIQDAAKAIVAGDLGRAETELQVVLGRSPGDYRASNLLGVIRAQQHREPEAEKLFKQVIEQKPDFAGAHVNLGMLYAQMERDDEAVAQFREALRLDPQRTDALSALVNVLRAQARAAVKAGNLEKGLALLLQARKDSPQDADVLFEFGMIALQMSLLPDAIQAFQDELAVRKDDPDTLYALGRAQIGMAQYQEARTSFERFLQIRPEDASGQYALGVVLQSLQQASEARLHFEKSVALQPVQTESYFQLGLIDLDEKHLDTALNQFNRVLKRDPKHAGALFGTGRVAFERREYQNAANLFERAIAADASLRQAHYYLGLAYARLGRKDDSEKELQAASQLEHQEVEKHRVVLKILNSDNAPPANADPAK
ncbi:MAG: tetratricopeptide repeat protein [Acidobacteriia bacterium]|nr:tetratricopeptide repeat protein [Terriglobia bacterium]